MEEQAEKSVERNGELVRKCASKLAMHACMHDHQCSPEIFNRTREVASMFVLGRTRDSLWRHLCVHIFDFCASDIWEMWRSRTCSPRKLSKKKKYATEHYRIGYTIVENVINERSLT